jgi:glycosyltransferase involved in cell wall biosynthesis
MTSTFIVACIPALNEEKNIGAVIVRTKRYVDSVIVCDDGSSDLTAEIAEGLGATVIRHNRNSGYGAALRSLFSRALDTEAEFIVTLDGDGQHNPAAIPRLLNAFSGEDVDIVVGSRFIEGGRSEAPPWRERGIKVITELITNGDMRVTDAQSGFRAYRRGVLELITLTEDGMGASTEMLLKAQNMNLKIAEVPINIVYPQNSSSHNPVLHGFDVILATFKHLSLRRPLIFYGVPGFLSLCISAIFWIWTFKRFTVYRELSTNITLIALSTTVVGLMLMTTAIILWAMISVIRENNGNNNYYLNEN